MLPNVISNLSKTRVREFEEIPKYLNGVFWHKAQKLQNHLVKSGQMKYLFATKKLFEQENDLEEITNDHLLRHLNRYFSKSFVEFKNDQILNIYDDEKQTCECKNFFHYGYCKHFLAVKIYQDQLKVIRFFFNAYYCRFPKSFQQKK